MKTPYTYTILRYMHDTTTGEFVNVGVALYAPATGYSGAVCRDTYGRVTKVFPGADGESFKAMMRHVQQRFADVCERLQAELPAIESRPKSVMDLARSILPEDASSLQWAPERSGLTEDASATLERLFERLVSRYDGRTKGETRSDDEVWKQFRRNLESRHVLRHLRPKVISSDRDEVEFKHAYKNGSWHCLEPLSFDLTTAEGIKDKARTWLGRMMAVNRSSEAFKVYLLVGEPKQGDLDRDFEKAISMLEMIPGEKEIVRESDADRWSEVFGRMVLAHERKEA